MDIVSIISLIIASFAFLFSIYSHIENTKQTERIKNINIKAKYFEAIFDDYLIRLIPEKRALIWFNQQGNLADFQPLIDTLSEMRNSAAYFRFENKKFYDSLKTSIRDVEDFLSDAGNHKYEKEDQADIYKKIAEKISNVYACINKYYLGL